MDLVPLNCFHVDNQFIFYDQEFFEENYPANAIIFRALVIAYGSDSKREAILPHTFFWKRYGLEKKIDYWQELSLKFTEKLRHQKELKDFNKKYHRDLQIVERNRNKLNYAISDYEDIVLNPFQNLKDKKLFIFGSGKFASKFIAMYRHDYPIDGILDNNTAKWGTTYEGYAIMNPLILMQMNPKEYKVIICVKDYKPILQQLKNMGVRNIGTYDMDRVYPGRQALAIPQTYCPDGKQKKYHIGYIAGVFDLFHLGHLNMFKRAKEQCDYLIVGVVSDAGVRHFKKTEPYVPFDERIEMVRSCRYVDEVVEIPFFYRGTKEAFQKYHFDCQFSGSDYVNDPGWLEMKKYLEDNGAEMVFFPYTQQTSSTKIKALIEKGLL